MCHRMERKTIDALSVAAQMASHEWIPENLAGFSRNWVWMCAHELWGFAFHLRFLLAVGCAAGNHSFFSICWGT